MLCRLEQRLVLQEIERAGNKGIWTRDIKTHTNIPQVGAEQRRLDDSERRLTVFRGGCRW